MKNIVCSIDIGSTLTQVLVARGEIEGSIEILGAGTTPSAGVRTGTIINIDQAVHSISEAAREAELVSGLVVEEALVNITGKHLRGDNSRGVVAITNRERIVRESDVLRVIEGAQNIRIPTDQDIIHVLSREFRVDDQGGIRDPLGMTGVRLEAEVHVVTAGLNAINNLEKAMAGAGIRLSGGVMSSLASAEAVLADGEKDLGVAVIDIGGGICDVIIYQDGGVYYSSIVPVGGIHVTQDLSIGLKIPLEIAEMMKKTYGAAFTAIIDPTERLEVPGIPGRPSRLILRHELVSIIEARMREIFELIDRELIKSGRKSLLAGGIIITGGGALLEGVRELAEDTIGIQAAIGAPSNLLGFSERVTGPDFSTVVGMIHYAGRVAARDENAAVMRGPSGGMLEKLKGWISRNL